MASFQRLSAIVNSKQQWNLTMAKRLVSSLNDVLVHSNEHPQMTVDALRLLIKVFAQWPDNVVYDAVTTPNKTGLIDSIFHLILNCTKECIPSFAILVLAKWWKVKEMIEWYISLDAFSEGSTAWIDRRAQLEHVGRKAVVLLLRYVQCGWLMVFCFAMDYLMFRPSLLVLLLHRNEMDHDSHDVLPIASHHEIRRSCAFMLSYLLKHNVLGWLHCASPAEASHDTVSQLCKCLLTESRCLRDNNLPASSSELGLACLMLLCLIQKRHHQSIPDLESLLCSTPIVEHVVRVAFPTELSTPRGPRWTYETCDYSVRECARQVIQVWSQQRETWSSFRESERLWRTFAEETWNCIMSENQNDTRLEQALPALLILHTAVGKVTSSEILYSILSKNESDSTSNQEQPYRCLLTSLLSLCHHVSSTAQSMDNPFSILRYLFHLTIYITKFCWYQRRIL